MKRGSLSLRCMPSRAGLVYEAPPRCPSSAFRCVRFGLISVRCQTVPSPFGSGLGDFEVAPWSSTLCCRKRRSEEERRSLYPETCSTHDERQFELLSFQFAVSIDSGCRDLMPRITLGPSFRSTANSGDQSEQSETGTDLARSAGTYVRPHASSCLKRGMRTPEIYS